MKPTETLLRPKPASVLPAAVLPATHGAAKPERPGARPKPSGPVTYTQSKGAGLFRPGKAKAV